jgi:hypothetical protein
MSIPFDEFVETVSPLARLGGSELTETDFDMLRTAWKIMLGRANEITAAEWRAAKLPEQEPTPEPGEKPSLDLDRYVDYRQWRQAVKKAVARGMIPAAEYNTPNSYNIVGYLRRFKQEMMRRGLWSLEAVKKSERTTHAAISSFQRRRLPDDVRIPARAYDLR